MVALPAAASWTPTASAGKAPPGAAREPALGGPASGLIRGLPSITGIVLGVGGRPLRGVCVIARSVARSSARPNDAAVSGVTGAGGRYALAGLSAGAYVISYRDCAEPGAYFEQWSGGADLASQAAPVLVGPGTPIRLAVVRLRPTRPAAFIAASAARFGHLSAAGGGDISGTVRNRAGKRLGGVCVFVYPKGNYFRGVGDSTGRKGRYEFSGLLPGRYQVQFTAGCPNPGNYAPQYWKYAASPAWAKVIRLRAGQNVVAVNARLGPGGCCRARCGPPGRGRRSEVSACP